MITKYDVAHNQPHHNNSPILRFSFSPQKNSKYIKNDDYRKPLKKRRIRRMENPWYSRHSRSMYFSRCIKIKSTFSSRYISQVIIKIDLNILSVLKYNKMVHKNNTKHQTTWRNKNPENMELHRKIARKSMIKIHAWNRIRMIFLRILL